MAELSAAARAFAARVTKDGFELQTCAACGTVAWPPREACARCWSDDLVWTAISPGGTLLAQTTLHVSLDKKFMAGAPWSVGTVKLDAGPVVTAFLDKNVKERARVRLFARKDCAGAGVLIAVNESAARVVDEKLKTLFESEHA